MPGKGGLAVKIPLSDEVMGDFWRYKSFFVENYPAASGDEAPLVLAEDNFALPMAPDRLQALIMEILERIARDWEKSQPKSAKLLRNTIHLWL